MALPEVLRHVNKTALSAPKITLFLLCYLCSLTVVAKSPTVIDAITDAFVGNTNNHVTNTAAANTAECMILLHGLARTKNSMKKLAQAFEEENFIVVNQGYPSRKKRIEALAEFTIPSALQACETAGASPVNVVGHSLGGILLRQYLETHEIPNLKRVVMLGPPNEGSAVVDALKRFPGFTLVNGPAGSQLGTKPNDLPNTLKTVDFELGIIAGTRTINLVLSQFLSNPDDGKVSVESTKTKNMCDFHTLPVAHPFLMNNAAVIAATIRFINHGYFGNEPKQLPGCRRYQEKSQNM